MEILLDELQRNDYMLDAKSLAVIGCERQFLAVMIAAVIEAQGHGDGVGVVVEHGHGIHAAG